LVLMTGLLVRLDSLFSKGCGRSLLLSLTRAVEFKPTKQLIGSLIENLPVLMVVFMG